MYDVSIQFTLLSVCDLASNIRAPASNNQLPELRVNDQLQEDEDEDFGPQEQRLAQRLDWARRISMSPTQEAKKVSVPVIPVYRFKQGDYVPDDEEVEEEEVEEEGDGGPEPEPEVRREVTERREEPDGRRVYISKTASRADELFTVNEQNKL